MKKYILFLALFFTPAYAQTVSGIDGKKPVEINADQLEVRQEEHKAIFTGNVIAVQGETRLKSDVMTVFYTPKDAPPTADVAAESSPAADATQSTIERIEVDGNVLLATPQESASGAKGVYHVDKKQITLTNNVTLTRGKNILKGDTLVYDFTTGKSVVNSPTQAGGKPGGRVKALFVPDETNDKKAQ